MTILIF